MKFVKYVYSYPGNMVDASDLIWHIYAHTSPIYAPERYSIYVKCGEYICFWLNTMHCLINGPE